MFPSDWNTQMGHKKKRRVADDAAQPQPPLAHTESPDCAANIPDEPPPSASTALEDLRLPSIILRNVNTASRAPATPAELNLDAIEAIKDQDES